MLPQLTDGFFPFFKTHFRLTQPSNLQLSFTSVETLALLKKQLEYTTKHYVNYFIYLIYHMHQKYVYHIKSKQLSMFKMIFIMYIKLIKRHCELKKGRKPLKELLQRQSFGKVKIFLSHTFAMNNN